MKVKINKKGKINFKAILFIIIILFLLLVSINIKKNKNINIKNNTIDTQNDEQVETSNFAVATVKRVVDGDTIIVTIENKDYKVRLIGVNSPESTKKVEPYGKVASNFTKKMLTNKKVYLTKDVSETDKYDRLLRYVWLEIPDSFKEKEIREKMFNSILVINGYAEAATFPPDVKYSNYFKKFANEAREKNIGLWSIK